LNICGPNCPGVYWDDGFSHPNEDIHCWGRISWKKIKYDVYGKYDVSNPRNYGSYHFHRYGDDAGRAEEILLNARIDISKAGNDASGDIPLIITEYNTSTGGNFDRKRLDTEDLSFGINMAQNLEASAVHGPAGLGDDGGIFVFKLGASQSGGPLVGLGNKLSYVSQNKPHNYGGITRGGACYQLYARHFRGGKALIPVSVTSGKHKRRRTVAAVDEENKVYYIYGSNCSGSDASVSIDLSSLKVSANTMVSLHRVDEKNTGQVTELLALERSKRLRFDAPNYTAYLIKVPMAGSLSPYLEVAPIDDATKSVKRTEIDGLSASMKVSNHHSDASQRQVGLIRFPLRGAKNTGKALLKLSGRNQGKDPLEREILHVYVVKNESWSEKAPMKWADAPGLGQYHVDKNKMGVTDGSGDMVDIEDNYAGLSSGAGTGLGICGEFVGAVSFHSSDYVTNYLDVTDALKSVITEGEAARDATFVIVRIVRYNVNEYENDYYKLGDYHYDGRVVEIATKEHQDKELRPTLLYSFQK